MRAIPKHNSRTQRWSRLLQPSNYPWNSEDPFVGGQLSPDPEIEDINDLARFIQISTMSPFPVILLMGLTQGENCYTDNVILYDAEEDQVILPVNLEPAIGRTTRQTGLKICMIGSLVKRSIPVEHTDRMLTFSTLVIDEGNKVVHRIDPECTVKPALDKEIAELINKNFKGFKYYTPENETASGAIYRNWDVMTLDNDQINTKFPENVHYKIWTFWMLHQRLSFADMSHDEVWNEFILRYNELTLDQIANLMLNFYPNFTGLAHYNAFGRDDFLNDRYRVELSLIHI